jgi:ABC-type Na+ efflux pump permease subunit
MNKRRMLAVIKKDIAAVTSSAQLWLPMVIVPLVFVIGIPLLITLISRNASLNEMNNSKQVEQYLLTIPLPELKEQLAVFPDLMQKAIYMFANYLFAPMFLIMPVMVSAIIASSSFAGEKEKKTLESLLFSPITEKELFFGKITAAFLPAMAVSVIGFIVYGAVLNIFGFPMFGKIFFPSLSWLPFMLLMVPSIALLSIGLTVAVSAKVKGFAEAQQISALIVLPLLLMVFSQILGLFFLSTLVCATAGAVLLAADYFLITRMAAGFNREKLLKNYTV